MYNSHFYKLKNILVMTYKARLVIIGFLITFISCEKEKIIEKEILIEPQLIASTDTLIFNEEESKALHLSTVPSSNTEYQITSFPNWIGVYPTSGEIINDIAEITVSSNFSSAEPGVYNEKLIIMSTAGIDTIY